MKPAIMLLAALSLALAAPIDAGARAGKWKSVEPSEVAEPIGPQEAARFIGQRASVVGVVSQVAHDARSGVTFINMGGSYPNHAFTAVIFRENRSNFSGIGGIEGRKVRFTGVIRSHKGKPQIILSDPSQLRLE